MAGSASAPVTIAPERPDVFISYSRRDEEFVDGHLRAALEARGKDVWIDVDDIRGGASDWRATIWSGIEAARAIIFVLTPDSLSSRICGEELAHAISLNKRIIPVLRRPVDGLPIPDALERPNWIDARDEDDFEAAVAALVSAVETDEEWLDLHARLTQRTAEWLQEDRDPSYLLRGSDLRAGERWLDDQGAHAERPTSDQIAYINAGRRASARRQRLLLGGVAVALGVSIALGVVAYVRGQTARSQAFAASAIDAARRDPEQALELALAAAELGRGRLVKRALREAVAASDWTGILRDAKPRPISELEISPDARLAVTAGGGPTATIWELRSGRRLASLEHAAKIHSVRFSPDGRRLVTASADGTARVWDRRGQRLDELRPGRRDVWSAEFARDGRRVITGTDRGEAQVWDLAARGRPIVLPGAAADHLAVTSFSPDGRRALTAGAGDTIRVWTLARRPSAVVLRPTAGNQLQATIAQFSPDGRRVLAGYDDGTVCVWTLRRSTPASSCNRAQTETITDADFNRDGSRIVTASADRTAMLRRGTGGQRIKRLPHRGPVNSAGFDPAHGRIVTAGDDRSARIWSAEGALERVLTGHTDAVVVARFSNDGKQLLTGSDDGSTRVWPAREATEFLPGRLLPGADAAFSPDARRLLAVDAAGRAALWDRLRHRRQTLDPMLPPGDALTAPCGRYTGCAPWAPDGLSFAGVDSRGEATIWDARTRTPRPIGVRDASGAAFSPGGRLLAVLRSEPAAALVMKRGGGTPVTTIPSSLPLYSAGFTADSRKLLTVAISGAARVFDATSGARAGPAAMAAVASAAAITRDGTRLAVGTRDGVLAVYSGGRVQRSRTLTRSITGVAFNRAGTRILTVSEDNTVRVWRPGSLDVPEAVLRGHTKRLISAEFSPDGRFVLTASEDRTVRVFDPTLETPILVLRASGRAGARFSPNGRLIALAGRRTLELHPCVVCAPYDTLRDIARSRLPKR